MVEMYCDCNHYYKWKCYLTIAMSCLICKFNDLTTDTMTLYICIIVYPMYIIDVQSFHPFLVHPSCYHAAIIIITSYLFLNPIFLLHSHPSLTTHYDEYGFIIETDTSIFIFEILEYVCAQHVVYNMLLR